MIEVCNILQDHFLMKNVAKPSLDITDLVFAFFFTVSSIWLRIWCIDHPNRCIFDEIHFGNFTNYYTENQFFFDIHPPLAKLIMYKIANLSEYDGSINFFLSSQTNYTQPEYVQLRLTPCIFSSLCIPLIYLALRFSSYTKLSSFTSSCLLLFDTSLLVEGKYILSDGILHFFVCLHICVISYTFSNDTFISWKSIEHLMNGITLGFACSCKNTAWGLCVYDAFIYITHLMPLFTNKQYKLFFNNLYSLGVTLFLYAFSLYLLSFILHFVILQYAGTGYYYLSEDMQQQLILNSQVKAPIRVVRLSGLNIILRSLKITEIMHRTNMKITKFHVSQSQPFNWPFLTGHDVGFWDSENGREHIACRGNLFVYYPGLAGLFLCLTCSLSKKYALNMRWVFGWIFSYFPFYLIPRTMYLYHYLIPLIFSSASVGASLDMLGFAPKAKGFLASNLLIFAFIGFYIWMPLVYGKYSHGDHIQNWYKAWNNGDKHYQLMKNHSLSSSTPSQNEDIFA